MSVLVGTRRAAVDVAGSRHVGIEVVGLGGAIAGARSRSCGTCNDRKTICSEKPIEGVRKHSDISACRHVSKVELYKHLVVVGGWWL